MATVTFLLPPAARLAGTLPPPVAAALGRADCTRGADAGERAQLLRHFDLLPRGWPIAALTRQADAGDAVGSAWLRADPAWVRPDINGARLFASGEGLRPTRDDCDVLLAALRPLFGDAGFPIDAPVPSRWYLRLPRQAQLPVFVEPADALGADVFDCLPQATASDAAIVRRWRALLNEAQVVLHNHPWNAQRVAAGKPPINSLWFWGGGLLPDQVRGRGGQVLSNESTLRALALAAGAAAATLPAGLEPNAGAGDRLVDLRDVRDAQVLARDWIAPALDGLRQDATARVMLDFADGSGFILRRGQRWRIWRSPLAGLRPEVTAAEQPN